MILANQQQQQQQQQQRQDNNYNDMYYVTLHTLCQMPEMCYIK